MASQVRRALPPDVSFFKMKAEQAKYLERTCKIPINKEITIWGIQKRI